ncbi:hypothetical protein SHKM778_25420 [Streptomyces sp. KM77-8]|uniref:GntR C-terminal domain-containing protein n=1 Tax=Streptomyces haneummycinicus TaxID=3074435 RepID=A0AAT9HF97_9ACTN
MRRRFAAVGERDLVDVRDALEVAAARLAALRRTEEDLRRLDGLLDSGTAFHRALVAASHNEALIALYSDLTQLLPYDEDRAGRACAGHARLLTAVHASAPQAAAAEAVSHVPAWHVST